MLTLQDHNVEFVSHYGEMRIQNTQTGMKECINLMDAVALAKAVLTYAATNSDLMEELEAEAAEAAMLERMESAWDARHDAISAHWGHD